MTYEKEVMALAWLGFIQVEDRGYRRFIQASCRTVCSEASFGEVGSLIFSPRKYAEIQWAQTSKT
jgi:hypothetical protein